MSKKRQTYRIRLQYSDEASTHISSKKKPSTANTKVADRLMNARPQKDIYIFESMFPNNDVMQEVFSIMRNLGRA